MPEMHLRLMHFKLRFIYSACGPFIKIQKAKKG